MGIELHRLTISINTTFMYLDLPFENWSRLYVPHRAMYVPHRAK